MIVAHANNLAIGKGNTLPWRVPADMAFFKSKTLEAKNLLVGKNTLLSLPKQQLPLRNLFVLSSTHQPLHNETPLRSICEALAINKTRPLTIIGGEQVYRLFMPYVTTLYVTQLNIDIEGADAFFPSYEHLFVRKNVIEEGISNNTNYAIIEFSR